MTENEIFSREISLIGNDRFNKLQTTSVAIIGLGGVGGAAFIALVRAGVGHITACDCDCFESSNLNRQLLATAQTIGVSKCDAAVEFAHLIDQKCDCVALNLRITPENVDEIFAHSPCWVIDAVDNVTAKLAIIEKCLSRSVNVISCMGTGNRLVPTFKIVDISETAGCGCPLARVMRRELRRRGIESGVKVLCGTEPALPSPAGSRVPASISYVPPIAGFMIAGEVVRNIIE